MTNNLNLNRRGAPGRGLPGLCVVQEMILSSTFLEPWQSGHMWFIAPGLVTWIGATIWWARRKTQWLPVIVQGIGAFEVALGGIAAYFAGIATIGSAAMNRGAWDPSMEAFDRGFFSEVAIICWGVHWILLVGTFVTMSATHKRRPKMKNNPEMATPRNPHD